MKETEQAMVIKPNTKVNQAYFSQQGQGKSDYSNSHNGDVKCFKYQGRGYIVTHSLNKHILILHDDGEYETEEENEEEAMLPMEDASDVEEPKMGRLVAVVKQTLNMQVK